MFCIAEPLSASFLTHGLFVTRIVFKFISKTNSIVDFIVTQNCAENIWLVSSMRKNKKVRSHNEVH